MNTRNSRKSGRDGRLAKVVQLLLMPFIAAVAWGIKSGQPKYPAGPHPVQTKPQALEIAGGPTNSTEPGSAPAKPTKQKPGVESYPATRFGEALSGIERARLDSLALAQVYRGEAAKTLYQFWWRESSGQPLLDSLLPGVRFYEMKVHDVSTVDASPHLRTVALRNGRLYTLERLNSLLLDAGFTFDSLAAPTIARVAVLVSLLGKTLASKLDVPLRLIAAPDAQAFPAVEFRKVERDSWIHPVHKDKRYGVSLDCVIDGKPVKLHLEFEGTGTPKQPFMLYDSASARLLVLFWRLTLPQLRQGGGSMRPQDDPPWRKLGTTTIFLTPLSVRVR